MDHAISLSETQYSGLRTLRPDQHASLGISPVAPADYGLLEYTSRLQLITVLLLLWKKKTGFGYVILQMMGNLQLLRPT